MFTLQRPTTTNQEDWQAYWKQKGQSWRWEPEIDEERQKYLNERRSIIPDIKQGIYPFKDIKLNRADVEWLLATLESGGMRGPVDWSDESQREREGLDLRGADLCQEDLRELPLACMRGGSGFRRADDDKLKLENLSISSLLSLEQLDAARVHLSDAVLFRTHLEGALLNDAYMERANLLTARLEEASLVRTHLEKANLSEAHLEKAELCEAHLEGANLVGAHLERANLSEAHLEDSKLANANLEGADLYAAYLEGKLMPNDALVRVRMWDENFPQVLFPAHLNGAYFNTATILEDTTLGEQEFGFVSLADVHWGGVNLSVMDWESVKMLGDEREARQSKTLGGQAKSRDERLNDCRTAVRANRQLTVALRDQGLNEEAARFAYRAQLMQRKVFWHQGRFGQYLFSLFLDMLAGYGYKPWRSFAAYLIVITAFATTYFIIGQTVGPVLSPLGALVFSMTSFHGRGFFPGGIGLDDPLTVVAAIEAFVGLLIEVTFIATLTQRLFGK